MSYGHIFAVASGFGLRLIPKRAPYQLRLGPASSQVDVECQYSEEWRFCRVTPDNGGYRSQLDQNTTLLADVLDIERGPTWNEWWIETTHYRVPFPEGWTLYSAGNSDDPCLFDFLGPGESDIFLRTPGVLPAPEALVGPGQQIRTEGRSARSAWIELDYIHNGQRWVQRHDLLYLEGMPVVVTLQAPAVHAPGGRSTLERVVQEVQRTSADRHGAAYFELQLTKAP